MKWFIDGVYIGGEELAAPSARTAAPSWGHKWGGVRAGEPRRHYPFPEAGPEPTATRGRYPGHKAAVARAEKETGTTAPFAKPGAPAEPHTSAAGMALSGAPGHAVDDAMKLEGLHERRDRDKIREYLRTGGAGMDPATTSWCAAFVNSSLQREGVKGSGSAVATSFVNWGKPATGGVQRGDVLVITRGHRAGETGGHVGMATGQTRQGPHGLEYEMISGNSSDQVRRTWEPATRVTARRARSSED